jgi:methoxymalonate biosynthesis acyl carrier protein
VTSSDQLTDEETTRTETTRTETTRTEKALVCYLNERLRTEVLPAQDLFDTGLVSSMFAMELVVHLERTYSVAVVGPDLKLNNFRSARTMAALVHRLRSNDVSTG